MDIAVLLIPVAAWAQATCYSPSDCAAPQVCSSVLDGVIPGRCTEPAAEQEPEPEEPAPTPIIDVAPPPTVPQAQEEQEPIVEEVIQETEESEEPEEIPQPNPAPSELAQEPEEEPRGFFQSIGDAFLYSVDTIFIEPARKLFCWFGGCE